MNSKRILLAFLLGGAVFSLTGCNNINENKIGNCNVKLSFIGYGIYQSHYSIGRATCTASGLRLKMIYDQGIEATIGKLSSSGSGFYSETHPNGNYIYLPGTVTINGNTWEANVSKKSSGIKNTLNGTVTAVLD